MAEYVANALQAVDANQNVLFTSTTICGGNSIRHRDESGLVTLRGLTNQCKARFKVTFGGNIAIPTGGTAGPISLAIAINGEAIPYTTMTVTPIDLNEFFNVNTSTYVEIFSGCCAQISINNISTQTISVQNANLIIERVA